MLWRYEIHTGRITLADDQGAVFAASGWAGQGPGKNNPAMCSVHNVGPLPPGNYTIGDPFDDAHTGKYSMNLTPDPANNMMGRSGFRIHGANANDPDHSSEGCIIQMRPVRERIHASGCRNLEVFV